MEDGIVIGINGQIAKVKINKANACAHCSAGCMEKDGMMIAEARNFAGAQIGDTVHLELNSATALTASLIVFVVPLLMLFIGAIASNWILSKTIYRDQSQILSFVVGIAAFFLTFIPVKMYDRHLKKSGSCSITVTEILHSPDQNFPE